MTLRFLGARAVGVAVCVAAVGGCTTIIPGAAHTVRTSPPAASSTAVPTIGDGPSGGFVAPTSLGAKLLKREEIAAAVGDDGLRPIQTYAKPDFSSVMQPPQCDYRAFPARSTAYMSPLLEGMAGEASSDDTTGVLVAQVISSWSTVDHPKMVLSTIPGEWRLCPEGQNFTSFSNGETTPWVSGPITTPSEDRTVSLMTRQTGTAKTCAHVVGAYLNTVIETLVCGAGDTVAQAGVIADGLLANLRA